MNTGQSLAFQGAAAVETRKSTWARVRFVLTEAFFYALLSAIAVLTVLPLAWMVSTSLKEPSQVAAVPPVWIPDPLRWENYGEAWNHAPFWLFFTNTIYVAFTVVAGTLFTSSLAGYAFARLQFVGRDFVFSIFLSTMMIPGIVFLIPQYVIFRTIGWIDTHLPLLIPPMMFSAFNIFLLRQFFKTLPQELEDAARIDGCSTFGIYWKIMLPQVGPALATVGIFSFFGTWNNFLGPLIYINSIEKQLLSVGLALFRTEVGVETNLLMAAATFTTAPLLIVYFFAQKYFIQGITLTGIKG